MTTMTSLLERFVKKYGRLPTEVDPDYLEMLNMSKYRILAAPDLKPGKCANCGAARNDGRGYVDFGLEVDWYGIVYLCGHCLKDIAKAAGLFDDLLLEVKKAKEEAASLTGLREKGDEIHETIVRTFSELKEYYVDVRTATDVGNIDSTISVEPNKDESGTEGSSGNESPTKKSEPGTTKPNSSRGSKDVPSLADLLG